MGKHYSVEGGNLYIYTTLGDPLLNLNVFPAELNLFEAESAWRISPWVAVVEDVLHEQMEKAQIVLQLNGYEHVYVDKEALESYFVAGNEQSLLQTIIAAETTEVVAQVRGGSEE
ncbi:hypothetical protein JXL21_07755 [Candidatus Bathyarchaeota archaeon]|nr:hypothetical protein [Candidatus Bathyarchaeota archaeon]